MSFNERAFILEIERANPERLAELLIRPSLEQEKALRAHLGDERYQRMHSLALTRNSKRRAGTVKPKGNVVVIHGIMGAELSVSSNNGPGDLTWVNAFRILRGWLDRLRLTADGKTEDNQKFKVTATGTLKRYYGEMLLALSENWNVRDFYFDWRKDLDQAADSLNERIGTWFDTNAPVHIVAHSMGGLVARTFIKRYPDRWVSMWDKQGNGKDGGRLIMLGTPNYGSFAIPQVMTGLEGLVRKLAKVDLRHDVPELLQTFNTFVGSYQMLPSPEMMSNIEPLYTAGTYSRFGVSASQRHLDKAREHHTLLKNVVDPARMIYVAGYDQPTYSDVVAWDKLNNTKGYAITLDGDGRVTHQLGLLKTPNGSKPVPTYYIRDDHGNLSTNSIILGALDELLKTGQTRALQPHLPARRDVKSQDKLRELYEKSLQDDDEKLALSLGRMSARSATATPVNGDGEGADGAARDVISPEERKVEESITRGFLAYHRDDVATQAPVETDDGLQSARIEIRLQQGGIESIAYDKLLSKKKRPVDAISVGHYIGVEPQRAELALDYAISAALLRKKDPAKLDLILTQYTGRGIIHGKLGQPFMMPDPRVKNQKNERLIAIAGMNEPGRFGKPELVVLARELCWALGRLNKVHLATVVIGSGEGNIPLREAMGGWLTGIQRAVAGSKFDKRRRLQCITFVELDERKVIELDQILTMEKNNRKSQKFEIDYEPLSKREVSRLKREAYKRARRELEKNWALAFEKNTSQADLTPSRVTLTHDPDRKTFRFGAITANASIPERETVIDPNLIWTANDELAGEQTSRVQLERGRFLEQLLMPNDLRSGLYGAAPLVMMLDSTTARIHWEMVAQPSMDNVLAQAAAASQNGKFELEDGFLGTSRGFTRQLRTTFAPPPEPPPPPQTILRILVVADPAEDAHLEGAEEEAVAIADLFESYNNIDRGPNPTRVEVKRLFGPIEATRTNVMRELMLRRYDILHFAGHCVYGWDGDPNLSGWIFNLKRKELLSAHELNRVDRIPKFVFSNACESGVTPDRAQDRNDKLAPSFAESFFNRGVANFVCTAWPVDDVAARRFALKLYSDLLGMKPNSAEASVPLSMHEAMRNARLEIASTPNGRTTWGAYQHYGNPYFRLFYEQGKGNTSSGKPKKTTKSRKRS